MLLWNRFWRDERGVVLSAEAVLVGSVVTVGVVAGLSSVSHAVDGELREIGFAIRSLDQSYVYNGHASPVAWTAGSYYIQPAVEVSHADLGARVDADVKAFQDRRDAFRKQSDAPDDPPKKDQKPVKRKRMKKTAEIEESSENPRLPNELPAQDSAS